MVIQNKYEDSLHMDNDHGFFIDNFYSGFAQTKLLVFLLHMVVHMKESECEIFEDNFGGIDS